MAASFTRPTVNRSVHLRITPRPSNLGESREIMRLLSQFGEIEYFKSLKYDALSAPNAALVIYREEQAAQACLRKSPIRFRMGRVVTRIQNEPHQRGGSNLTSSISTMSLSGDRLSGDSMDSQANNLPAQSRALSTSTLPTMSRPSMRMPFDQSSSTDVPDHADDESRLFQITTNRTNRNFRDQINVGRYHGGFAIRPSMPGQEDLAKKVPFPGLSCIDWKASERPWRIIAAEKKRMASKGSLGQMYRESKGIAGDTAAAPMATLESPNKKVDEEFFRPFKVEGRDADGKDEQPPSDDTLDTILKGWESMFPGGQAGSEQTQRYSGKPK